MTTLRQVAKASAVESQDAWRAALGDISGMVIEGNFLLVAPYIGSEKIGSLFKTDEHLEQARYQAKTGFVLKCGPVAFRDDENVRFGGVGVKNGDWVIFHPRKIFEIFVNGLPLRLLEDVDVMARVTDPEMIY